MKWQYDLYIDKAHLTDPQFSQKYEEQYLAYWNVASAKPRWDTKNFTDVRWKNDEGECFKELVVDSTGQEREVTFMLWKNRTKPGVDSVEWPTYELTELGRHTKHDAAKWAASSRIGKRGKLAFDYGIVDALGGDWLCVGGDISYDGKYYISKLTYKWSGTSKDWDHDLYQHWED